jgi:CheY-like chemotaxis protein
MRNYDILCTPRILLVDDDAEQLELYAQLFKLYGFAVVTAGGPTEAISMMLGETMADIDVAVLDHSMPVMNGCDLADQLRAMCPELKVILYSGAIDIPQSEMTSVDAFVLKGSGIARLLEQAVQLTHAIAATHTNGEPDLEVASQAESRPI